MHSGMNTFHVVCETEGCPQKDKVRLVNLPIVGEELFVTPVVVCQPCGVEPSFYRPEQLSPPEPAPEAESTSG